MIYNETEVKEEHSEPTPELAETNEHTAIQNTSSEEVEESSTREERKKERLKKPRVRVFPIWLRLILVVALFAVALASGLAIGFGVVGDGNAMDVFDKETWQHIIDLVKKDK